MGKPLKWLEPSEKEIENQILHYLNYQPGCFAFKVNTVGIFDQRQGFYRRPSKFVIPGTPDIIVCYDVCGIGVFIGLEVKSEHGRQSRDQVDFEEKLHHRAKGLYFIVKSIPDVERALGIAKALGTKLANGVHV